MNRKLSLLFLFLLLLPVRVSAQAITSVRAIDSATGATTDVGDATNHAFRATIQNGITFASPQAVTQSGTWTVTQSGAWTVAATQSGNWLVQGMAASGAAKSGNPLQMGGVFNTTQPTVTTGQMVEAQYTARGAAIVAVGVDGFATSATQSGTWNINNITGTVTLPTLAATSTKQSDGTQKTQIVDGAGNVIASTSNNLNVQCANCSGSGVSTGDEATFTAGSSLFAGSGGFFQTTATNNALTTGQQGMFQVTANRALFTNLRNAAGTEIGTAGTPIQVSLANTAANGTAVTVDTELPAAAAAADGAANPTAPFVVSANSLFNGTTWDRWKGAANALNSTGTGIGAVQVVGQFDDVAPTAITENQFGNLRMSTNRNLYGTIRDAAGNERGANVSAGNALLVDASATTQPISGSVTANIGTTNGLALDASVTGLQVAQGSTTSGQKGGLALGAVTTNAPTYTTGQSSPISIDTAGLTRVSIKDTPSNTNNLNVNLAASAATVTVTGTVTTTPPANASTNVAQFGGTNVVTGTGAGGAGIPRVTVSNDSTVTANAGTNLNTSALVLDATVTGRLPAGASPANGESNTNTNLSRMGVYNFTYNGATWDRWTGAVTQGTSPWVENLTQFGGTPVTIGKQLSSASIPVVHASDDPVVVALAQLSNAIRTSTSGKAGFLGTFGRPVTSTGDALDVNVKYPAASFDPCLGLTKDSVAISQTANALLLTGTNRRYVICQFKAVAADAENLSLVEGTGATCGTGTAAIDGGTTAANGPNYVAGSGSVDGNGGAAILYQHTAGNNICLLQSGSGRVSGHLTYALAN